MPRRGMVGAPWRKQQHATPWQGGSAALPRRGMAGAAPCHAVAWRERSKGMCAHSWHRFARCRRRGVRWGAWHLDRRRQAHAGSGSAGARRQSPAVYSCWGHGRRRRQVLQGDSARDWDAQGGHADHREGEHNAAPGGTNTHGTRSAARPPLTGGKTEAAAAHRAAPGRDHRKWPLRTERV